MCTVTWVHEDDGYRLFCNRDEKNGRSIAEPPRVFSENGVRFVAPRDSDHGGSWISVNEAGVTLCLLNGPPGRAGSTSRGTLVMECAGCLSQLQVAQRVSRRALGVYAPFTLAVLEPGLRAMVLEWDGGELAVFPNGEPFLPLASSSLDNEGVQRIRTELFETIDAISAEALTGFHSGHDPVRGAYSPCMHRSDASTVSHTQVVVSAGSISMRYQAAPPCESGLVSEVQIHAPLYFDCAVYAGQ